MRIFYFNPYFPKLVQSERSISVALRTIDCFTYYNFVNNTPELSLSIIRLTSYFHSLE